MSIKDATELDFTIGQQIYTARTTRGLSREDLASKLQISTEQLRKYEKGVNRIPASRLSDVGKILNKSLSWFMGVTQSDDRTLELVQHFQKIKSGTIRCAVMNLLRGLSS